MSSQDIVCPAAQGLPDFLEKNNYRDVDDIHDCPWQIGKKTSQTAFQFLFLHPRQLEDFNAFMTHQRMGSKSFLDVYPLQEEVANAPLESTRALFVDIGGGVRHICDALKQQYPDIPGRVIVQDLPETITQAPSRPGVEAMAHDYFTPQPIKGAKYYYFRNIMHNLADKDCLRILEQTRGAISEDSLVLIDEIVLPVKGTHWRAAQLDMLMLSGLGAVERTERQWNALLSKARFKVVSMHHYDDVQHDAVLAIAPM